MGRPAQVEAFLEPIRAALCGPRDETDTGYFDREEPEAFAKLWGSVVGGLRRWAETVTARDRQRVKQRAQSHYGRLVGPELQFSEVKKLVSARSSL